MIDAEPARPVTETETRSRAESARRTAYRSRFALVYVALAVVVGGGVGSFIVLISKPEAAPAPSWSSWKPDGSPDSRVKQIADRVSKRYRLPSGTQLAVALVGPPAVSAGGQTGDVPVRAVAVRPDTSTGQKEENDIDIIDARSSMMFILCGLGESCSIGEGKASEARHALLRREALELSLYTFKYRDDVSAITVFLPPRKDAQASPTAVFLKRADLKDELRKPLNRTLNPTAPALGQIPEAELANVNRTTRPHLYSYEYTQAQDGSAILVLSPIALGA